MTRRRSRRVLERLVTFLLVALVVVWLVSKVSGLAGAILGLALLPVFVVVGLWSFVDDLRPPRRTRDDRDRT